MNVDNKFNIGDRVHVGGWGGGYGVVKRILPEIGGWSTDVYCQMYYQIALDNCTSVKRHEDCLKLQPAPTVPYISPHYFQD